MSDCQWIRRDMRIGDRYSVLLAGAIDHPALHEMLLDILSSRLVNDECKEHYLSELVSNERPELMGCVVYSVAFSPNKPQWRIGVAHESLSSVFPESEPVAKYLLPSDQEKFIP